MDAITLDVRSINAVAAGQLSLDSLVDDLSLPQGSDKTISTIVGDNGYLISRSFHAGDGLLTINLKGDGPLKLLSQDARAEALSRLIHCATRVFTGRSRSIPVKWKPFHHGNLLSFHADKLLSYSDGGRTDSGRIIVSQSQSVGIELFAFHLDKEGVLDLSKFEPPQQMHQSAISGVVDALGSFSEPQATRLGGAVNLDSTLPAQLNAGAGIDTWYQRWLTSAQREFVDHNDIGGLRLVGPAGTGKTRALVIKCLRLLAQDETGEKRALFLTHASVTSAAVEQMILEMEPEVGLEYLVGEGSRLQVVTLYQLAAEQMKYDLSKLSPVSIDGHGGRQFQADVLNECIENLRSDDWIGYKSGCSAPFITYMSSVKDSQERRFFLWELLNEFACVLDADGVRSSNQKRERYLTEKRKSWAMTLENRVEREVVLALYDAFRASLRSMRAIGTDQMVVDYLNELDSFRWDNQRHSSGFDYVFVDELHLFNRHERTTFRHLMRDPDVVPVVYMAYDAKQSPRDTFLNTSSSDALDLWKEFNFRKAPKKIELSEVFRYTPQILAFISSLDSQFPGQDLGEEWPSFNAFSQIDPGPVPTVTVLEGVGATYAYVFRRAKQKQLELGRKGRVAVLCASNDLFTEYLNDTTSPLKDSFMVIESRDAAAGGMKSSKKFVFSTPEYVAGLQFDTVYLIDVNDDEVPQGPHSSGALRKFVSMVYLGASRAQRILEIYANGKCGGPASVLNAPILSSLLIARES